VPPRLWTTPSVHRGRCPERQDLVGRPPTLSVPGCTVPIMTATSPQEPGSGPGLDATALRPWNVVAIALSAISPTTSVFLVYGSVLQVSGTGVVWAFLVAGLIALAMALCYAEVGSVFPSAGGVYALVRGALGSVAGGVTAVLFMLLGLVSTASILVAAATYVGALTPAGSLSTTTTGLVAFGFMVLVTALSIGRIAPASWAAAAMLGLEVAVIVVFTVAAFAHPAAGAGAAFTAPVGPDGGTLGAAALLAGVAPALFAFNGYDWPLYFAEETPVARRRALPRAVLLSAGLAVVLEVVAVIAATGAVRDVGATRSPVRSWGRSARWCCWSGSSWPWSTPGSPRTSATPVSTTRPGATGCCPVRWGVPWRGSHPGRKCRPRPSRCCSSATGCSVWPPRSTSSSPRPASSSW
jgi:amino acid transporter